MRTLSALLQWLYYYGVCTVTYKANYCTVYGRAELFAGPVPPEGLLRPATINGRFTADAALIRPGVLLLRTPPRWTEDMCNIESDAVLGGPTVRLWPFVPGQLILVRGEGLWPVWWLWNAVS